MNSSSTANIKTGPIPTYNKGLAQARHIQAKLNGRIIDAVPLDNGQLWSPITAGPYLVPLTRWIE